MYNYQIYIRDLYKVYFFHGEIDRGENERTNVRSNLVWFRLWLILMAVQCSGEAAQAFVMSRFRILSTEHSLAAFTEYASVSTATFTGTFSANSSITRISCFTKRTILSWFRFAFFFKVTWFTWPWNFGFTHVKYRKINGQC